MSTENWRSNELSLKEVTEKYPDFPKLIALKIDVDRRGIRFTDEAYKYVDPGFHYTQKVVVHKGEPGQKILDIPQGFAFRDGTVSCTDVITDQPRAYRDPYTLDVVEGKLRLVDNDEVLEEISFWEKPDFFGKKTSNGTLMESLVDVRPQRVTFTPNPKCHFWDKPGNGCKYCSFHSETRGHEITVGDERYFQDIFEVASEAVKQKGRFSQFHMVSGSDFSGEKPFDTEVNLYIKAMQSVGKAVKEKKVPFKLVASSFSKEQLKRLYEETPLTTYTTDLEVLNEEKFKWICPGKAEVVGYQRWKQSLYDAVEIFGRGNVDSGLVGGVELAQPYGFLTEEEALKAVLAEADEIASHGVSFAEIVWKTGKYSYFYKQKTPSLDYYVQLAQGLADVRRKYGLNIYTDDFRRCGNHPNTDLARID
ncbi:MAG: radical SAM protein [Lachnospiraceae bacterium]|nr:radical SAM protein [Lachnospiraceae bacterium]